MGKPVAWIGSSRRDIRQLPDGLQREFGQALWVAQLGGKHEDAKPLKGFGGAGVLEIVESYEGGAYRAVYTVRFEEAVYVLHVFQKKSRRGIETPKADVDLIKRRLREAEEQHREWMERKGQNGKRSFGEAATCSQTWVCRIPKLSLQRLR